MASFRVLVASVIVALMTIVLSPAPAQAWERLHGGYATLEKCQIERGKSMRQDANNYPVYWSPCFQWVPGVSAGWFFRSYTK